MTTRSFSSWRNNIVLALLLAVAPVIGFATQIDHGRPIYQTTDPFNGPFGFWGYDIIPTQSVAVRFIPDADFTLETIKIWFMSNDWSGQSHPKVTLELRTDAPLEDGQSIPSDRVLEAWDVEVTAQGWNPVEETVVSRVKVALLAGQKYWISARGDTKPGKDAVWVQSSGSVGITSNTQAQDGGKWEPVGDLTGAAPAITITGVSMLK